MRNVPIRLLDDMLDPERNSFGVVRLAMALAVVVSHSFYLASGAEKVSEPLYAITGYTLGQHAVQVFFILSGILVAQSLMRGGVASFLKARALRIFPALIVTVLVTSLLLGPLVSTLAPSAYLASPELASYIWQTVSLKTGIAPLPGVFVNNPAAGVVNSSVWTLKYEAGCYIALALAGGLAMWLGRVRLIGFAALAIMLALAVADRPNLALQSTMPQTVQYFALFFGTGVLAYGLRRQLPVHWAGMVLTGLVAVATNDTRWAEIGQALVLGYGTIYLGSFRLGALGAFTSRQDWSYGVYLYGVPIGQTLMLLSPGLDAWTLMGLTIALVLIPAGLSWNLVEKPALALRHRGKTKPEAARLEEILGARERRARIVRDLRAPNVMQAAIAARMPRPERPAIVTRDGACGCMVA